MNILMVTNTFTPQVGGVARSVEGFAARYRELGHRVVVAAPEFEGTAPFEPDVIRLPALQRFNGSDFSMPYPVPGLLRRALQRVRPDLVHSHHPFLLGDSALRVAAAENVPIVFTHHTMYELYTHYVPGDSSRFRRFVIDLATGYCNLCDAVIAPSRDTAEILKKRGVTVPIEVIPTGVDCEFFASGAGPDFRAAHGIPADAFVVGHVGRLAPEKNLEFLSRALVRFAGREAHARVHLLIVGEGPGALRIEAEFAQAGLRDRLHFTGVLARSFLPDAYDAMDAFVFASQSETQGMVLMEAMAAGVPPVGIDAPGVREIVRDRSNGRLLATESLEEFSDALRWIAERRGPDLRRLRQATVETALEFSMVRSADQALALYRRLIEARPERRASSARSPWRTARRRLAEEWKILVHRADAARHAWAREPSDDAP